MTQRLLPFVLVIFSLDSPPLLAGFLSGWLAVLGLSTMLAHQLYDFENDKVAEVSTWTQKVGLNRATWTTAIFAVVVVLYTLVAMLLFGTEIGLAIAAILLLLFAKQMIWIGEILLKSTRAIRFQKLESQITPQLLKVGKSLPDPVSMGREFLLARIRSGELATRAPDDCPHKNWDWMGEPYLALNSVMAMNDHLDDIDRARLGARILQLQEQGTWDYTHGGRGADVDTTASAIRALDRLGQHVELTGLHSFHDPGSGLFNTFKTPGERLGLCLPPQSLDRHFGAHPCVLPNVWLLLHERKQLSNIEPGILRGILGQDGLWPSYFYPSRYYATRLYVELLTAMGANYNTLLKPTLDTLLTCEPTPSPTQNAEIAISLLHLKPCFTNQLDEIQVKVKELVNSLRSMQFNDGSWAGETIWEFMHRTHPEPVKGYDCFRVHATALCVRALSLGQ